MNYSSLRNCISITVYTQHVTEVTLVLAGQAASSVQPPHTKRLAHFEHAILYTTTLLVHPVLTVSTLYWVSTNTSPQTSNVTLVYLLDCTDFFSQPSTNIIWPSSSVLYSLMAFSTNHNLVLFIFTFIPLPFTPSFHQLSFLISSSSLSAVKTKSSTYSNFHGKVKEKSTIPHGVW